MKKVLPILLVASSLIGCHPGQKADDPVFIRQLDSLLDKKEYFRLERQILLYSQALSTPRRLYYDAILDNVFNRNDLCIARIDSLLTRLPADWPDSLKAKGLQYQGDSYFKTGQYALAAHTDSLLIHQFGHAIDSTTLEDAKNHWLIRIALRHIPPQTAAPGSDSGVSWSRDRIELIEFPLRCGARTVSAIFDTRANISSITQTYADMLHLHMLDVHYREGAGVTGISFTVGLAVADSLYIGTTLVRNVVFQVMPDSIFYIAPIRFQLNIIVGLPVIAGLQEVRIYDDGRLVIPSAPTPGDLHNMALDGLDPVLLLSSGPDSALYYFDSGAGQSILYATWFDMHRAIVRRTAVKKRTTLGGAGGIKEKDSYTLPYVAFTLGGKTIAIDSVTVLTDKTSPGERFYGNMGEDFMRRFKVLTLNFKDMYIKGW